MNNFRKIALTVPACIFAFATFAQTAQDPKAKLILDEVSKTAKAYTTITASFSITMKNKENKTDTNNGSMLFKSAKYNIPL